MNFSVTVHSNRNSANPGLGSGGRSARNTTRSEFTNHARLIRENSGGTAYAPASPAGPRTTVDLPLLGGFFRRRLENRVRRNAIHLYGRCSAFFLTLALAVFGPRERSTRSARMFSASSRSGSIAGSL